IAEIDGDPVRENLVRFMLQFSKLSGVRLIAEGIERREELDRLIAIGVAYGQGYLFGRPAAVPGVDQEELDQLRAKISDTSSSRVLSALGDVIGPMSRPCCVADPNSTIGEAAAALRSSPGACGMLVECAAGSHWIDRETTEREADAGRKEEKLVRLGEPTGVPIDASTPLADALQMLASRQLPISTPLPVLRGDQVIGVVNPTDVLFRSALEMRTVRSRRSPLTGLPGRVACEELMQRHFLNRAEGVGIIFADLRNFSEFNETFGFDLGDDVVRELVASVAEGFDDLGTVPETAFVGHQGDDRLIIVGSNDCIERLAPRIVARFRDRLAPVLRSAIVARDERRALPAVGVRLLIEDDAFLHHRNARELVKTERLLRRLADEQITRAPNAPGWVVRRPAEDGELAAA
ncbi:MAG: EAL domain-containing protein, partial [Planctomycetota bacterium]